MLADTLHAQADVDLGQLFAGVSAAFLHPDLGSTRFDASGLLQLVARAAPVQLGGVTGAVDRVGVTATVSVRAGLPGAELPGTVTGLGTLVGRLSGAPFGDLPVPDGIGLDDLAARLEAVRAGAGDLPLAQLLAAVPGASLPDALTRVGGGLGGLVEVARVLVGLAAHAAVTARLVARTDLLAGRLDTAAARAAADRLTAVAADPALVAALRSADPDDPVVVEQLGGQVLAFLDTAGHAADRLRICLGFGEATLAGLDLAASGAGLETARLAVTGARPQAAAPLVADLVAAAGPLLRFELPHRPAGAADLVTEALAVVAGLTDAVRAVDAAALTAPLRRAADLVLDPLDEVRRTIETVAVGAASAIRALRQLVADLDLSSVAAAVQGALQPVVDTLDAVQDAVEQAGQVLTTVLEDLRKGLAAVAKTVQDAATTVRQTLSGLTATLRGLHLGELAATLEADLRGVRDALASAQLAPYFDTAVDVIETSAAVIDKVPFGLLPTDVQQEVVDVCRPIKQLDLDPVEATLHAELEQIRGTVRADVVAQLQAAYQAVVGVLAALDPAPALRELEDTALPQLRAAVDAVDPAALLQPVQQALDGFRGTLAGLDLRATVLAPVQQAFAPVQDALAGLDPSHLFDPLVAQVNALRTQVRGALHLDTAAQAVHGFRDAAAALIGRLDAEGLAGVLDESFGAALAALPAGPPGGPFGSVLVGLAQASGLDADEGAVGDVVAWVSGRDDGASVVRGRLALTATRLAAVRDDVRGLDPAPLAAAAQARYREIGAALAARPAGSLLRSTLEPLLTLAPADTLGPLVENRRRYLAALDAAAALATQLAASGRAEVSQAAAALRATLGPLQVFPARVRALAAALGLEGTDRPFGELLGHLIDIAGPHRLVPALTGLVAAVRDTLLRLLDAAVDPVLGGLDRVTAVLDALDVGAVVAELVALYRQIVAEVAALSPDAVFGPVLGHADGVLARLRAFDPLAPVREAVDAATGTARQVLETARPTVVFAPVVTLHAELMTTAGGLDVAALLGPVLDALDGIAGQLDAGFNRTGEALEALQAVLPSQVQESVVSVTAQVSVP